MIYEIFRYNSQNFPQYFLNYNEIILDIARSYFGKFSRLFLKYFKIIPQTSGKISGNFPKYFQKFFEIFQNDLILKIFRNNSRNFLKYFLKFSNIFLEIMQIFFDILFENFKKIPISWTFIHIHFKPKLKNFSDHTV